jgi:molybdopterin-guanine dinucleotide biosynthesis protein A
MAERQACAATGGVLLAGGLSTRFGAEKAVAKLRDGLLMDVVCARFAPLARIAVSARPGSAAERHARVCRLDVLHDDPTHPNGPLAGLAAGLAWANQHRLRFVATAPCDTPRLPIDLFSTLLDRIGKAPAAFAVTPEGLNPLCAVWRTDMLARLLTRLKDHHPSVRSVHADWGSIPVRFDDAAAFINANTREALAALEARL